MPTAETSAPVHDASTSQVEVDNAHSVQEELTFPQILDGISALVSCMTPAGAVETVNRHVLDYFGKTLEELKQWTNTDAIHPEDRPGAIALWRRSVDSGEPYDMEVRQRGADGVYRWFHVQGLPVRGPEGHLIRWCVLQTDIDERKRAQDAVRESERELRHLIDNIPGFVCTLSATGEVELVNRQFLEYFGKTNEELKGWTTSEAVHPDDLPGGIDAWRQSIETGQPYLRELRQRRADGVYRWLQSRALPTRDTTGRITGWYMVATDIHDRRNAEEALRQSERELRQLVDNVPGMIAVADPKGKCEYVNKRTMDFLDTDPEGFRDRPMDTVHPDDQDSLRSVWQRCKATGEPMDFVHRVRRFDGAYRWVHVRGEALLDDRGRIVRWYYVLTDIDDQRRAEEALRESERELRQLVDSVPGMISVADSKGELEYANKRFLDYMGTPVEELSDVGYLQPIHPDDREMAQNEWLRCQALGQPLELNHRLRRFDGVYRWVHVRVDPLLDDRGRIVRWYSLHTDIDDQRRAEEKLRRSEADLRLILDSIPAMVYTMHADGRIDRVNQQLLTFLSTTAEALNEWISFIHSDDRSRVLALWESAILAGQPYDVEHRLRRGDGVYRWFNSRGIPVRDEEGRVVRWYSLLTDVDDHRTAEEALRSTRRKLSSAMQVATVAELSASIAHEINQPLASVVTNAHAAEAWLSHDPPNLERARTTLERIIRDGHSAAEVLRRIRLLFKEAAPVKAALDVNQIVAEVLGVLSEELRDKASSLRRNWKPLCQ